MIAVAAPGFLGHLPSNSDLGVNFLFSANQEPRFGFARVFPRMVRQQVTWGAFHHVRPTDGTTISDQTWTTSRNDSCHFLFLFRIHHALKSTLLKRRRAMNRFVKTERQVFQSHWSDLSKWTTSRGGPEYSGQN